MRRALVPAVLCLLTFVPMAQADAESDGRALAAEIRSTRPGQRVDVRGSIRMRDAEGRRRSAPFHYRAGMQGAGWEAVYETSGGDSVPQERLVVVFRDGEAPTYLVEASTGTNTLTTPKQIRDDAAMTPFAGSDFWLTDLGLGFVHWPRQRIATEVKLRMRKGRSCRVLESINPRPDARGYTRVLSWVDLETNQPILAEAYGPDGKLLKEFEIGGVTKVNGVWELKNMEMRDVQKDSRTVLEFKYEQKE